MAIGDLSRNAQGFFIKSPNENAAQVSQTRAAIDKTTTNTKFTEKSVKSHPATALGYGLGVTQ